MRSLAGQLARTAVFLVFGIGARFGARAAVEAGPPTLASVALVVLGRLDVAVAAVAGAPLAAKAVTAGRAVSL
jgi:hypothetical protein